MTNEEIQEELGRLTQHVGSDVRDKLLRSLSCPDCGGNLTWKIDRDIQHISLEEKQRAAAFFGYELPANEKDSFLRGRETSEVHCAVCAFEIRDGHLCARSGVIE